MHCRIEPGQHRAQAGQHLKMPRPMNFPSKNLCWSKSITPRECTLKGALLARGVGLAGVDGCTGFIMPRQPAHCTQTGSRPGPVHLTQQYIASSCCICRAGCMYQQCRDADTPSMQASNAGVVILQHCCASIAHRCFTLVHCESPQICLWSETSTSDALPGRAMLINVFPPFQSSFIARGSTALASPGTWPNGTTVGPPADAFGTSSHDVGTRLPLESAYTSPKRCARHSEGDIAILGKKLTESVVSHNRVKCQQLQYRSGEPTSRPGLGATILNLRGRVLLSSAPYSGLRQPVS